MIRSKQHNFSESQVLSATGASTNIIDLGVPGTVLGAPAALRRDIGKGNKITLVVKLDAAAGGTSPTLDVVLQTDSDPGFGSPTEVARAPQVVSGSTGDRVALFMIPRETAERYLRVYYTLGGTSPTYTVSAFIPAADQETETVPGV